MDEMLTGMKDGDEQTRSASHRVVLGEPSIKRGCSTQPRNNLNSPSSERKMKLDNACSSTHSLPTNRSGSTNYNVNGRTNDNSNWRNKKDCDSSNVSPWARSFSQSTRQRSSRPNRLICDPETVMASTSSNAGFHDFSKWRQKPQDTERMLNNKFGYRCLKELAEEKDSDEIVIHICQNYDLFKLFLKNKPQSDIINLLLRVMAKAIGTGFKENKLKLYALLCEADFVAHINTHIISYLNVKDPKKLEEGFLFFQNFNSLCNDLIVTVPSKAVDSVDNLLSVVLMMVTKISVRDDTFIPLVEISRKLREDMDLVKKRWEETDCTKLIQHEEPPNDFRELSLYPTPDDFTQENFLRHNIVKGSYENPYHYLDVQFRLLREDFIDPLRQGFLLYKEKLLSHEAKNKKNHNLRFYWNVRFLGLWYDTSNPGDLSFTVQLDRKFCQKIRWNCSKRLLFGSLCLFSKDNFETFQLATVSVRDLKELNEQGTIAVRLVGHSVFGNELLTSDFVMAESSSFFEPVYQVLNTLRNLPTDKLPMEKYLLMKDIEPQRPQYMTADKRVEINGHEMSVDDECTWPPGETLGFNDSQLSALKASLRNEFVVIQGPPGTGKTHLGLNIVKTLLKNFDFNGPILMVCYTNHALDQFLEGLLSVTDKIIRIGGQSKNEALNMHNYQIVRRNYRIQRHPDIAEYKSTMICCLDKISSFSRFLSGVHNNVGVIDLLKYKEAKLRGVGDFESSSDLLSWLLGDMFQPVNYLLKEYKSDEAPESVDCNTSQNMEVDDLDEEEERRRKYYDAFNDIEDLALLSEVKGKVHYSLTIDKLEHILCRLRDLLLELNRMGSSDEDKQVILSDITMVLDVKTNLLNYLSHPDIKPSKQYSDLFKHNLWEICDKDRWALYHYWIRDIHKYISEETMKQQAKYSEALNTMNEIKVMEDYDCLRRADPKILGLTTTGAARHHGLIKILKPPVIVVEEAAEVLEAHIVASLTDSCQHLILIGDHKQLKPNPSTFKLAKKYQLDISLFERMIKNGVCCHTLNVQHRMKPNIASLIAPTIYSDLINHHSVEEYPPVMGIAHNLFFIDHTHQEIKDEDIESRSNPHEAEFMIALCRHLLLQGYEPSDITILTTYSAQQFYLRDLKKVHSLMREVRITVVDNYQGEESKIILLSLVRSKDEDGIGFLKTENRVCVALSRAKHGLYIIGNMTHLKGNSEIWQQISTTLQQQQSIGESLSLVCQVHKEVTRVKEAKDFEQVIEGGCNQMCLRMMPCKHTCQRLCHVIDLEHDDTQCSQPCNREICVEPGHNCPLMCYEECKPCEVPMDRELPQCGHNAIMPCHVAPSEYKCKIIVNDTKEDCKHAVERYCFMGITDVQCKTGCDIRLDCGHACSRSCHINDDPDHDLYKCMKDCTKKNAECKFNHMCTKRCYEECGMCTVKVKHTLPCGHVHEMDCSSDLDQFKCTRTCGKTMECGHPCKKDCHLPCGDCKQMVEKTIDFCGHKVKMECCSPATREMCKVACQRLLPCGHRCKLKCSQDCSNYKCLEYVDSPVQPASGHKAQVLCYKKNDYVDGTSDLLLRYCKEPCGKELPCKHMCTGTCGNCMQGRIHQECYEKCSNILICGHKWTSLCRDGCRPCRQSCLFRCKHSMCKNKCGVPCVSCNVKCDWGCKHTRCTKLCGQLCDREPCNEPCDKILSCNHPCVGFCGEPCPPLCRICDRDQLCQVFFGTEEEDDARFVFLNDCRHTLESSGLDAWCSVKPEEGRGRQIGIRRCPKCNTNIITTQRYGNAIKTTFQQVQKVKQKIFGTNMSVWDIQKELATDLLPTLRRQILSSPRFVSEDDHFAEIMGLLSKVERANIRSRNRHNNLSIGELKLFKFHCLCLTNLLLSCMALKDYPEPDVPVISDLHSKIKFRFNLLMYHLSKRKNNISEEEIKQFESELARFTAVVRFYSSLVNLYYHSKEQSTGAVARQIVTRFFSIQLFDYEEVITREINDFLTLVSNSVRYYKYNEVTQNKKYMIHKVMKKNFYSSNKQGHWYSCSNGHIYDITECGGAMEQSGGPVGWKCPECKETIGRTRHSLVSTSRLASIMDEAIQAAWSTHNNMDL